MVPAKLGNWEKVGKFMMGRENEILKNLMLQGSQSTRKYTTPKRSYNLKCTSYLAPLAYMPSSIHAVLVIITGWHNQPHFTLLPTPHPQASFPSPTHYYLARHWCTGARNAMNLVCRKSKIREKTDLGAWGRRQAQLQAGDWGRLSGCFSQIRKIREKIDFRGGKGEWERGGGGGGKGVR